MTREERFAYIESLVISDEERREDWDEHEALSKVTQHNIDELSTSVLQLSEESREANQHLEERIASLASGFGQFIC
jgi:hypothetical protein